MVNDKLLAKLGVCIEMKIQPLSIKLNDGYNRNSYQNTNLIKKNTTVDSVSFGSTIFTKARRVEKELATKGMACEFRNNYFVGDCVRKVSAVFEKLFGKASLPENVNFRELNSRALGICNPVAKEVAFNARYACFDNIDNLTKQAKAARRILFPNDFSSLHPAHVFVHEFSHNAHWEHLCARNGYNNALKVWQGLTGVGVPTAIGRLITRFKLGNYAVDGQDMCEFVAERMSKDICKAMDENTWNLTKSVDVGYSNIFNRKWNYRYSTPQSYVDYFTQQVWNGDIEEAERAGRLADQYLRELDAVKVRESVAVAEKVTEGIPILNKVTSFFANLNRALTGKRDERNKLKLKL